MSLIEQALGRAGLRMKAEKVPPRPAWGYGDGAYGSYEGLVGDMQGRRLQRLAMQCAWVYSDVSLIARKVGGARLSVERVTGEDQSEAIESHPFEELMQCPNDLLSGTFLKQYTSTWLGLAGEAYWWLGAIGRELLEIWPLPARDVKPIPGKRGSGQVLAGYQYEPMGQRLIPPEMIVHFRTVNPFDLLRGFAPPDALEYEIRGDRSMKGWNFGWFDKKNATPTTVISLPTTTTKEDFNRTRKQLRNEFGGVKRRALVIKAGQVDVKAVGISQKDMDFLAGIELNRETVDRVYGIPAGYWAKDASRNVSETAERLVMRDAVQPQVDAIAEDVTARVVVPFYGEGLVVKTTNLVPEDRELRRRERETYWEVYTVDEARGELGLEPLGGEVGGELVPRAVTQRWADGADQVQEQGEQVEDEAAKADLRRWMRVAASAAARGEDPGEREFVSHAIPWRVQEQIAGKLLGAVSGEEVRAAFGPWVRNGGGREASGVGLMEEWRGYP